MEKYGIETVDKRSDSEKIAEHECEHPEKDKIERDGAVYCVKCQKYINIEDLDD